MCVTGRLTSWSVWTLLTSFPMCVNERSRVACQRNGRTILWGLSHLLFPFLGSPSTGALHLLYFLSFYNHFDSLVLMPLVSSQVPSFVPQEKKSARCCRFKSLIDSGFIAQNLAFYIGPKRLEQTFHWLISASRDFWSPRASFSIHLNKGSLVPPCAHMAGPCSPGLLHYLYKVVGCFIPPSGLLHYLYKVVGCFVPPSGSSFLVPDPRSGSSFRILVPRSGCNYRFITPSPPSEKEASLNPGITYNNNF